MAREMKNSGVKWIGEIPKEWFMTKYKSVGSVLSGFPFNSENFTQDTGFPLIRIRDITSGCAGTFYSGSYPNNYIIHNGDFLLGMDGDFNVRWWNGGDALLNQRCCRLKLNEKLYAKYIYYLIPYGLKLINDLAYSTTVKHLSVPDILNLNILMPPLPEQKAIADFLDKKCAEIDGLLADLEAEVKTLAEYKKSIIAETVTRGLNPNAPMKQSGIPWAETIPAHWDIHPIYYYFTQRIHKNIFGIEQNLLSLSYGNIIRKDINTTGGLLPASYNTYNIVEANDIVIRPTDLQNDKRSLRTGFVREHGIITSAYITLQPKDNIHSPYFHYLLHSYDIKKVFYNMGNGVRQGLNYSEFSRLMVFEPPIEEQKNIAEFLDEKCAMIDQSTADKQTQIETLKSYKSSLIYEYVTGKKQVI